MPDLGQLTAEKGLDSDALFRSRLAGPGRLALAIHPNQFRALWDAMTPQERWRLRHRKRRLNARKAMASCP